jgi:hypothetical protein
LRTPPRLDRTDTQRSVLPGVVPESAICVQRFDDSLNSAIRITYRISLRSSSVREPRYPLLRVVLYVKYNSTVSVSSEQSINLVCKKGVDDKVSSQRQMISKSDTATQTDIASKSSRFSTTAAGTEKITVSSRTRVTNSREFERFGLVLMILPQVHLRKPCYDFYFL